MSQSRLDDERALNRLVDRYARAVDRGDGALLASLFTDDATLDFGALFEGGRDSFVAMIGVAMAGMSTHHLMANRLYVIEGDRAEGEIYSLNTHVMPAPGGGTRDYVAAGRYLDRYRRADGEWRIAHRTRVIDWTNEGGVGSGATLIGGKRGSDPSDGFALLARLHAGG